MRSRFLAGAALAAALAAGCRRAPDAPSPAPDSAAGVTLAAPAPSSTVVISPLDSGASSYTNEMQAQNLRDEAAQLGIRRFARPSAELGSETQDDRPTIGYQEGLDRTRAYEREIEAERHSIEKDKNKPVTVPGQTPAILFGDKQGVPIAKDPDEGN